MTHTMQLNGHTLSAILAFRGKGNLDCLFWYPRECALAATDGTRALVFHPEHHDTPDLTGAPDVFALFTHTKVYKRAVYAISTEGILQGGRTPIGRWSMRTGPVLRSVFPTTPPCAVDTLRVNPALFAGLPRVDWTMAFYARPAPIVLSAPFWTAVISVRK